MREFVLEVSIVAVVRVRAETEADARQAVTSSALASPSTDEIRLANQANFIEGKKARSPRLIFRLWATPSSSGMSTRGRRVPPDRFPAIDFRSEGALTRTVFRANLGTFTPCFRTFTSRSNFPCIH
jgi:hypothetical protein